MIRARIRKSFPARVESAPFTLEVDFSTSGGVTVLFGPSGAGKTLTLDIIAGFVRPDEGRVMLDDEILFDAATRVHLEPQARHCGYVFQNYALFPHMTLRENLTFAANCASRSRKPRMERHRKVNEMIERFRLEDSAGRKPSEVSGGQKQRCSIARVLIGEPKVLLLDEPARGLDAPLKAELYAVLRQVRADFSNIFNHPMASGPSSTSGRVQNATPPSMSINSTTPLGYYSEKIGSRTFQAMVRFDF